MTAPIRQTSTIKLASPAWQNRSPKSPRPAAASPLSAPVRCGESGAPRRLLPRRAPMDERRHPRLAGTRRLHSRARRLDSRARRLDRLGCRVRRAAGASGRAGRTVTFPGPPSPSRSWPSDRACCRSTGWSNERSRSTGL